MTHHLSLTKFSLVGLFIVTRLFIWVFRPIEFTEVTYSYMPYAHLWDSGEIPYLEQWYEYPPATIPLFYLPHLIDKFTYGQILSLNYLQVYRGMFFLIDVAIFIMIWKVLLKYQVAYQMVTIAIIYYCFVTAKAHHFIYDTMDLSFAAAMVLGVAAPIISSSSKSLFVSWLGTFLATALKLVNAPLIPVYALLDKKQWKSLFLWGGIALVIIWGLPLLYFRSSLQVMLVYHRMRGLQVESTPAVITSVINSFTHTEKFVEAYKNYEIVGPISTTVKHFFEPLFYFVIVAFITGASWVSFQTKNRDVNFLRHQLTLIYIFIFMLTAKVLSTPFLLWHIPFVAMYPYKDRKTQLVVLLVSFLIVLLSMSPIPKMAIGILDTHKLIGLARLIGFLFLLIIFLFDTKHRSVNVRK